MYTFLQSSFFNIIKLSILWYQDKTEDDGDNPGHHINNIRIGASAELVQRFNGILVEMKQWLKPVN